MPTKVSIIIVTYNSASFIEKLLESIFEFNSGQNFEIILVDNNSTDKTLRKIRDISKIRIIKNKENLGFARAINVGAKEATGELLLLVNPDTYWKRGSVGNLVSVIDRDVRAGIVGGMLINKQGKAEKSAGKFLGVSQTLITAVGLDEIMGVRFAPKRTERVDFVSGGFMMIRRDVFKKIGGFDENLFIYVEDMDLCFTAKVAGYDTYFTPDAVLEHESHGSSSREFAIKNIYKGILYFHKKHGTSLSYLTVKLLLKSKAAALVIGGKIINNKYLVDTYSGALKG